MVRVSSSVLSMSVVSRAVSSFLVSGWDMRVPKRCVLRNGVSCIDLFLWSLWVCG